MVSPNPGNVEPNPAAPREAPAVPPSIQGDEWLGKKLLDDNGNAYRTIWQIYIQFYTVVLTVNIAAMGFVVQFVQQVNRFPIVLVLAISNVIGAVTSIAIARFSWKSGETYENLCKLYIQSDSEPRHKKLVGLASSPIPKWLGSLAGALCAVVLVLQACGWLAIEHFGK
jgi:hypothetical protein